MPHPTAIGIAALLAIAGTAFGVHLGHATVGEINPAYLQDPEVPFYSDLVPGGRPRADWAQVQAQEYQAEAQAPPPASCVDCTWPVAPTPREDPAIARYDRVQYARYEAEPPRERIEAPAEAVIVEQPAAERDWSRVTRYASYPVGRDDASARGQQEDEGDDDVDGGDGDAARQ